MALQHLYSRVPARVSMYKKADGFDTFAQSAGLEQEFVERELAPAYENKLNKIDASMIRQNKMPSVYTQYTTRTGTIVQSCISYLPVDYTGERSAYLSHSLILTPEEKDQILSTKKSDAMNPALFDKDIDCFHITAPNATPNRDYPCKIYTPGQPESEDSLLLGFAEDTVKSFLYAVLYSVCGKGRNVCFKLPGDDEGLSLRSVGLFNELLSIFPCQLRTALPFASFVTDPAQYNNYKIRGVSAAFPENAAKCAYVDFETDLIIGIQHNEVVENKDLIHFFYLLLKDKVLRGEFLAFMERAAKTMPGTQSLNLKVLGNLVFLFRCSCGLFPEAEAIPNDEAVYDCLCVYEKYRDVLSEQYRMQTYRCLLRYPQNHRAIPKNVFAKLSRLYASETSPVKSIVMNVVLELIHTDVMRDKLFTFIRNHYSDENADMKQLIITDLSRVFYGGFLQNPLLSFFSEQFASESETSRTQILEKLLLSIRTPAVQGKILAFMDQHYPNMTESHKDRFYQTFLEMLPECDSLADRMIAFVNKHMEGESGERKSELMRRLIPIVKKRCSDGNCDILLLLASHPGFSRDVVIQQVFGPWRTRKEYDVYIAFLSEKTATEKTEVLTQIFKQVSKPDEEDMLTTAMKLYQNDLEKGGLELWLKVAEQIQALPERFANLLHTAFLEQTIACKACDVFAVSTETDAMALLKKYADAHPKVQESEPYQIVAHYNGMIEAAQRMDFGQLEQQLSYLLQHPESLPPMAEYLAESQYRASPQTEEAALCLAILQQLLQHGAADLGELYKACLKKHPAEQAMVLLLSVCSPMSEAGPILSAALTAPNSGMTGFVAAFVNGYGKGAYHRLRNELPQTTAFGTRLEETIQQYKKANGSFLSKLFGKK